MALTKKDRRLRIKRRIRKIVSGSTERPRLSVYRSNKEIYAQLIDDSKGETLITASSREKEVVSKKVNKKEKAALVGKILADRAGSKGFDTVTFDRNGYLYHGRVKAFADAAREGGLKF